MARSFGADLADLYSGGQHFCHQFSVAGLADEEDEQDYPVAPGDNLKQGQDRVVRMNPINYLISTLQITNTVVKKRKSVQL